MNKKRIIVLALLLSLTLPACGSDMGTQEAQPQTETQPETSQAVTQENNSSDTTTAGQTEATETNDHAAEDDPNAPHPGGVFTIDGINVTYYDDVLNDTTGNWRLAVIADGSDLNDYVVDFYKEFIRDDSEVFGIVNLTQKTSAQISRIDDEWLDISVTEYQPGEEHDAKQLYGGMELGHYRINTKTGEIDNLEE